MVLTSLIYGQF